MQPWFLEKGCLNRATLTGSVRSNAVELVFPARRPPRLFPDSLLSPAQLPVIQRNQISHVTISSRPTISTSRARRWIIQEVKNKKGSKMRKFGGPVIRWNLPRLCAAHCLTLQCAHLSRFISNLLSLIEDISQRVDRTVPATSCSWSVLFALFRATMPNRD